jgi:signal transduction histidine kinase
MAAETAAIAPVPEASSPKNPISRARIETVLARAVGGFGLLFFAFQGLPALQNQTDILNPGWSTLVIAAVFGGLVAVTVASLLRRFVVQANTFVAIAYLVSFATWPLGVEGTPGPEEGQPWLYAIMTVATSCAAIAFPVWAASVYTVLLPVLYGVVRIMPGGGGASLSSTALEVVYSIILGGAALVLVTVLRQATSAVDAAQHTALDRYSHAVRQHATEVERVQVDAIVHDSVLTTFLSAARAYTPEAQELAARMAQNAIRHLADAAVSTGEDGSLVPVSTLTHRIAASAGDFAVPFDLKIGECSGHGLPEGASEALYSATMQAMVNSVQHAGRRERPVRRWVSVEGKADGGGIQIEVGDDGVGFDTRHVPSERLGLRVSIIDRVAKAGGAVTVESDLGGGTLVRVAWPKNDHPGPAVAADGGMA